MHYISDVPGAVILLSQSYNNLLAPEFYISILAHLYVKCE